MSQFKQTLQQNTKIMNYMIHTIGCLQDPSGGYTFKRIYMYVSLVLNIRNTSLAVYSIIGDFPDKLDQLVFDIIPLLVAGLATLKLRNFIKFRDEFASLMKTIEDNFWYANSERPAEEREIIEQFSRYVYICCLLQSCMIVGAGTLWLFKPLLDMVVMSRVNPEEPVKNQLPLNSWWPFGLDPYESPIYEIEYFVQGMACYCSLSALAATFCLFFHLVLNTCAQFQLIQMRLKQFNITKTGSMAGPDEQEKAVHSCISLHQNTLTFCSNMETVLTMSLFWECIIITGMLCIAGFIATMFPGNVYVYAFCSAVVLASWSDIFFHCLPPTMLTTEAFNISYAAYDSEWYEAPLQVQKQIMFIIARSQRPVNLTAGNLTPMSVETFEAITRTSASYFTVLTSMKAA